ncbi:xanthine dehydrogenase small subunit (plasmid) [Sinorhizobium meliloti WSM1022]|jgi:xanthine dehydrogenase small subunit|uniref:Probabable xanthine dehydrogenase protein n=4 Tax=Rhizobium meliloti TaxID=382 RepID=F7XGG0_SINMM|nr:xanthine dehydrogenase small subunit [Sinorhizobium meliloti]AEG08182.1 xanthine dehydrogenase, small subunit [Sinorhizobium meliloti BL225C]AEH83636.1 probabable xanthine dehydrogenase protein [Sinorhizobium meliloti SM11]AIM03306.1 FAD-binding molybdopterin dehydrogenase [Sinorhizobium meliloti]ASJ63109.1 xanthine dehydrogenase small subunit [Sinorhizobium meliloti]ASP55068.1 xanthine dehydrogenase small subunit [Sinorhizobium meliloti]
MTTEIRNTIRFLLNDRPVELADVSPVQTLLDFLRIDRSLRGTKEGCAEGDCGACTVLVGRLLDGKLKYESVNACIRFVASLDGCHVVTVEALAQPNGPLHPVQQAMVDTHASQCGFCTPGFVMSLYGLWMTNAKPSVQEIEKALQGNLCRCTGYAAIIRAAEAIASVGELGKDPLIVEREEITRQLEALRDGCRVEIGGEDERVVLPASLDDFAAVLEANPKATIVAGSTDVGLWVTKFMRDIAPVVHLSHLEELRRISIAPDGITLAAGVSYTEAYPVIVRNFPQLRELWDRIGGEQVRNMGTVGGNIANGSPIGDTPPALIALGASVTLRKGTSRRTLPLEAFFIEYGKQDREPGEFVETVRIPFLDETERFAVYKITKRFDEDISAVCGAFRVKLDGDGKVADVAIAFGGMAGTPKRASNVEAALKGAQWNDAAIEAGVAAFERDFTPLTDWRASSEYRMLVARNLLRRFHLETQETRNIRIDRTVAVAM